MKELKTAHEDYQQGFNEGYLLKKHLPTLADQLEPYLNESLRSSGLHDGMEQYVYEIKKERYPSWLQNGVPPNIDREIEKEKDKDEPSIDKE